MCGCGDTFDWDDFEREDEETEREEETVEVTEEFSIPVRINEEVKAE